jgi:hypothetical protein
MRRRNWQPCWRHLFGVSPLDTLTLAAAIDPMDAIPSR